ncbi:hypothetical protein QFC21_002841 [Naganishia friedmannii]|uniref:Uncharacterized protein n=1 Tax=Naganishia friedmannii TaxID=89922 RepID=A0ACC2VTJ4_9TREE|nr:hypothetical protein QFC21_002841 [Naganishia friedmannii]
MPFQIDPDVLDIDIPILPRVRTVQPPAHDRDSANMDIPILFRLKCRIQAPPAGTYSKRDAFRVPPSTPVYWSEEMERESSGKTHGEVGVNDGDEDAWVVLSERARLFGRVDMDEMTA